jgi:uncharacterized protein (TIRG00374 family)
VGLLTSAFFLWLTFRGEDLGEIWCQFMSGDPYWLMLAGAIATSGGLIRALRWRLLLSPLKVETSLHSRWAALNIGFMVTNVYPGRLGEIVRPLALSRMAPVTMSGALGTVVLERVLDTVALVLLLLISLLAPTFPSDATVLGRPIGIAVIAAVVLAVTILVLMVCIIVWPSRLTVVAVGLARRLPGHLDDGLAEKLESFVSGLQLLRRPAAMVQAMAWSLLLWVWMAGSFWAGFRAFGIELGAMAALFTQCAVSVFVAIPAAPGFLGTMQAGIAVSVHEVFGVAAGPTLSLAIGYHLAGFIPVTLLGLYYASRLGLRVGAVESEAESALERETESD